MLKECIENVRKNIPLVHNITNYVTVNDVANAILACGGSPIMSDEPSDVEDITSICSVLNINIGTLNKQSIEGMRRAAGKANELAHPIVIDPVGAGASKLRTNTALEIMRDFSPTVIRGNISEIKALAFGNGTTSGVDADVADAVTDNNLETAIQFVKDFSKETNAVIAVTGAIDLVSDGKKCAVIRNGLAQMSRVTGTGCQLSGIAAAFTAANENNVFLAVTAAVCTMGLAGEIAYTNMKTHDGNSTYRNRIIDAIYNMNGDILEKGANYEIR